MNGTARIREEGTGGENETQVRKGHKVQGRKDAEMEGNQA